MTEPLCRMKLTLGEVEACPQGACPFWEHGGAVLEAGCGLERLHLELDRSDLAAYFDELRRRSRLPATTRPPGRTASVRRSSLRPSSPAADCPDTL